MQTSLWRIDGGEDRGSNDGRIKDNMLYYDLSQMPSFSSLRYLGAVRKRGQTTMRGKIEKWLLRQDVYTSLRVGFPLIRSS